MTEQLQQERPQNRHAWALLDQDGQEREEKAQDDEQNFHNASFTSTLVFVSVPQPSQC
jgi:hypothetical protein